MKALRKLYYSYAHSIVSFNIIFWITPLILLKHSEYKEKNQDLRPIRKKMDPRDQLSAESFMLFSVPPGIC